MHYITKKNELRSRLKILRHHLFLSCPEAEEKVVEYLSEKYPLLDEERVGLYWSKEWEFPTHFLYMHLIRKGIVCGLPSTTSNGIVFRVWDMASPPLIKGSFDVLEPSVDCRLFTPTLLLVPLLGFDKNGNRLGYGGGYFDRFLKDHLIKTLGLGFSGQEVKEGVPKEDHDMPIDGILTEKGCFTL